MKNTFLIFIFFLLSYNCAWTQTTESLRVISWNVFLRPAILNDGQTERVDSIAHYLQNSEADVLVLQEVFHRKARKKLRQKLINKYPYQTKVGKTSFFGISSGVIIFSKYSILEEKHVSFDHATGSDRLAKKGGISVVIRFKDKLLQIIGTHLQAGKGEKRKRIRKKQIEKLTQLSPSTKSIDASIYAGDFNISQGTEAYFELLETLNCLNKTPNGKIKSTANFSDQELMTAKGASKWIDFILLRKKRKVKISQSKIHSPRYLVRNKKKRLSDHNPILSTIELH